MRSEQGYGVYESMGAVAAPIVQQVAAPSSIATLLRLGLQVSPTGVPLDVRPATPPSKDVAAPSKSVMPLYRPARPAFRLTLQPARRRVAVPLPVPASAAPSVRQTTQTLSAAAAPAKTMELAIPGLPPPLPGMPSIGFVQHANLWIVDPAQIGVVAQILGAMSYAPVGPQAGDAMTGQIVFVPFQTSGNAWATIQARVAQGYAALVDKASVATGTLTVLFTQNAVTVAQLAGGPSATHALIVDQPAALVDQADQLLTPAPGKPDPKETGTCPPGTTGQPGFCVPAVGPGTAAGGGWWAGLSTTEKTVGVGAAALAVVAIAVLVKRRK